MNLPSLFDTTPLELYERRQAKRHARIRYERLKRDLCPNCKAVRTHSTCDQCGESCPS